MKKKILLIIMTILAVACIFAISVGAKTITYEGEEIEIVDDLGDPSWYTGTTASKIQDKESIVILKDSEGNKTAYPSYYVFRYVIDSSGVRIAWANDNGVDYSFVNTTGGKNYELGSMYYVELPYGITACYNTNVWGKGKAEPNVVEFVLPDSVTYISYNGFSEINNCKKITMSKNITTIDEWAFYNSKDLETVVFPEGSALIRINKSVFNSCSKLSNINLENCQSLTTLGEGAFSGCAGIDKLYLPDSVTSIGFQALYGLGEVELASDYLPTSLTYIGNYFFSDCQVKNEVLYFPEGFTSLSSRYHFIGTYAPKTTLTLVFLGKMTEVNLLDTQLTTFLDNGSKERLKLVFAQNSFSDIKDPVVSLVELNGEKGFVAISKDGSPLYSTNSAGTLSVVFENQNYYNLTDIGTDANGNTIYSASNSPTEMIFCGGDTIEVSYSIRCSHTDKGWYRFHTVAEAYDVAGHTNVGVHYNSRVHQPGNCGYDETFTNTCVICDLQSVTVGQLATGEHTYTDDHNCETALECDVCKKIIIEALTHDIGTVYEYKNGYAKKGEKTTGCTNEGCQHGKATEIIDEIFDSRGYSVYEKELAITHKVVINREALDEYQKYLEETKGSEVTILYGVVAAIAEDGCKPVTSEGKAETGYRAIVASAQNTSYTMLEIKLCGIDEPDILLNCNAYIIIDGKVSYINDKETSDTARNVSYNELNV